MPKLAIVATCFCLLLACQAPFGTDRHDLQHDRIVTLEAVSVEGGVRVWPWFLQDGLLMADGVQVQWSWVPVDDASSFSPASHPPFSEALAPVVSWPSSGEWLGLTADFPSGTRRFAVLASPTGAAPAGRPTLEVEQILDFGLQDGDPDTLTIEARLPLATAPRSPLTSGASARLTLQGTFDRARWMQLGDEGTFLELTTSTSDWTPWQLHLDDLEVEEAEPTPDGLRTFVALGLTRGWVRPALLDVFSGPSGESSPLPHGLFLSGRFLPTDGPPPADGLVALTLLADTSSNALLRGTDLQPVPADELDEDDPWGTEALPCRTPVSGPFDPTWVSGSRCDLAAVDGARIVVEVTP